MDNAKPRYKRGDKVRILSGDEEATVMYAVQNADGWMLDSKGLPIYEVRVNKSQRSILVSEEDMVYDHFAALDKLRSALKRNRPK